MKIQLLKSADLPKKNLNLAVLAGTATQKGKKKLKLTQANKDADAIVSKEFDGSTYLAGQNEVALFRQCAVDGFENLLAVSIGDTSKAGSENYRQAGAALYKAAKASKSKKWALNIEKLPTNLSTGDALQAVVEGALLANYTYDDHKDLASKKGKAKKTEELTIYLTTSKAPSAGLKKSLQTAEILAECTNFSKHLGDTPGNLMHPPQLAAEIKKASQGVKGLKITVWDKEKIKKERFGGLHSVSLGSEIHPRFIIMEYKGAPASKKPIIFVGKGLTFDSGGISIKPSQSMDEMKYDMCGGANVAGALLAIAKLGLKINAKAYIPSTENMPGPLANKPGDILKIRNGKTVEVLNTDAEGRLILADALSYATEKKPAAIFDAATLTGAMVMALGNSHTGVFTRNDKLRDKIQDAANKADETIWGMPITDDHVNDIKGTFADLQNISKFRGAGSSTAAAFLEQFVGEDIPWAHFDIAGTAWNCANRLNYAPAKGATGVMVRTFVELAKKF